MNPFTIAQILENIQFVKRGKPCSVLTVKCLDSQDALELIKKDELNGFICATADENWCELWIYKRDEMREIIDKLPKIPESKLDHFILGCAFGYSLDSILDYIKETE